MGLSFLYGDNKKSKSLFSKSKKYAAICYHKNNKIIFKFRSKKKKIKKEQKLKFLVTIKSPRDRAAFQLLRKEYKNAKIFNINNKKFNSKKNNINIYSYKKKLHLIKKKIRKFDVISFDLFETILDKSLSNPSDIYDLVYKNNGDKEYINKRYKIEKKLVQDRNFSFNFKDIHEEFNKKSKINYKQINRFFNEEKKIEFDSLLARMEVIDLIYYSKKLNKKIILISDTWYDKKFIIEILKKFKINIFNEIYLSSENSKSKFDGSIYPYVKKKNEGKILHIGDNLNSDYKNALNYNLTAMTIPTIDSLLLNSKYSEIYTFNQSIYSKIIIGLIKKKFSELIYDSIKKGNRIKINSSNDFGFLFFGPLCLLFANFLIQISRENKINKILLCSREGFFMNKILLHLKKQKLNIPQFTYFLTSRKIASLSSFRNFNDIINSFNLHRFEGNFKLLIESRFNLKLPSKLKKFKDFKINTVKNKKKLSFLIGKIKKIILQKSFETRSNYEKYILGLTKNKKVLFVDQGFYGSCQGYIEKILNKKFYGAYVCYYKNNIRNKGLYDFNDSFFKKDQIIFESFFTAPHGSIRDIKKNQVFLMDKTQQNQKKFKVKEKIFKGVINFINDYKKFIHLNSSTKSIFFCENSKKLSDFMFGEIKKNKKNISKNILNSFNHDNLFVKKKVYKLKI